MAKFLMMQRSMRFGQIACSIEVSRVGVLREGSHCRAEHIFRACVLTFRVGQEMQVKSVKLLSSHLLVNGLCLLVLPSLQASFLHRARRI